MQPRIAIPTITVHYDQDTITIYMAAQHRTVCCLTTLLESRVLIILITRIRVTNSGCLFLETMDPRVAPRHVVRQSIRKLAESFMFPPGITIVSENDMKTTTQNHHDGPPIVHQWHRACRLSGTRMSLSSHRIHCSSISNTTSVV